MEIQEISLHLGFLIEEMRSGLTPEERELIGVEIQSLEKDASSARICLERPGNQQITFEVHSLQSPGWGADFQIYENGGENLLSTGKSAFAFTQLSWLLEQLGDLQTEEPQEVNWPDQAPSAG